MTRLAIIAFTAIALAIGVYVAVNSPADTENTAERALLNVDPVSISVETLPDVRPATSSTDIAEEDLADSPEDQASNAEPPTDSVEELISEDRPIFAPPEWEVHSDLVALNRRFANEEVNLEWARLTESQVYSGSQNMNFNVSHIEAECKTTICRIQLATDQILPTLAEQGEFSLETHKMVKDIIENDPEQLDAVKSTISNTDAATTSVLFLYKDSQQDQSTGIDRATLDQIIQQSQGEDAAQEAPSVNGL